MILISTIRRFLAVTVSVTSLAMLVGGCDLFYPSSTIRYRMTVEVETPGGLRSGSSVIETKAWETNGLNGRSVQSELHGEAVAVELPNHQVLFALLKGVDGLEGGYAYAAYNPLLPITITKNADWRVSAGAIKAQTAAATLTTEHYPIMVRFRDIRDPRSVEAVDPDNLSASFGTGVRLKRIVVQVTDDPVATGILKRLPKTDDRGFFNWDGHSNPNEKSVFGIWNFATGQKA